MEQSFKIVQQLVANFKANESAYLASNYSESQVRSDFIDKFFTALGWDVTHTKQFNPYEQEVKIENKVTMPGTQRRADYAFFIMPNYRDVKFFTEAKKPSRNLSNPDDYYQAIRYAWNANTPIAVLTDFEEFHILDCRYKPDIKDSINRKIKQYHYSHYADEEKFKEIFYLFGREAVANGSLEKFAADLPKPRGKAIQGGLFKGGYKSVDEAFLEQLDEYRNTLAKAFKKENQELGGEELTEAVQRTIDRLVFIRFLEDKGIEEPQIIGLHEHKSAWNSFLAICKRFEPKYNGLIFKPHRILDGNTFNPPDDRDFADICGELSDPTSPYDFDKIPISILGSIYERFLGKVVHATAKRVEVQEKPEVRKAGGVYYTPEYIVRYIVKETVGKLIENKTPEEIAKMSFADIACGSGSFLIEVYSVLLEYHDRWYNTNRSKAKKEDVFERDGHLHLSLKKKKEILTNNVYGVDIDFQATEVTQLSLYLKLLENVSMNETHQMGLFKETILPNLNNNIVCGNSLIGTDIGGLFESEEMGKLKTMNFEDAFPIITKRNGFDAIVGNPPYLFITELDKLQKDYFFKKYFSSEYRFDIYGLFIELSIKKLLKIEGLIGYIIPHTLLSNDSFQKLRHLLLTESILKKVVDIGPGVFVGAKNETMILICQKGFIESNIIEVIVTTAKSFLDENKTIEVEQSRWKTNPKFRWSIKSSNSESLIISKIESKGIKLGTYCTINQGLRTGDNEKYLSNIRKSNKWLPAAGGKQVARYNVLETGLYVNYDPELLDAPRKREIFESAEKLVVQEIRNITLPRRIIAAYDSKQVFCLQSTNVINKKKTPNLPDLKYLLGIINSNAINYFFKQKYSGNNHIASNQLSEIPIPNPDKDIQDNVENLVNQMLDAKQKLSASKTDGEVNRLELLCASLDRKIDEAVYELYGLTEEEIKIVEGK